MVYFELIVKKRKENSFLENKKQVREKRIIDQGAGTFKYALSFNLFLTCKKIL